MTKDIDVVLFGHGALADASDGFLPAPEAAPEPEPAPEPLQQETVEALRSIEASGPERIMAVVLRSRSGSDRPHIVTVMALPKGERAVWCTCEAFLAIERRPSGCWAMRYVRTIARIPEPGGPA